MMGGPRAAKAAVDLDDDAIPAWQRQSMERSLQAARARAHERSDRFVAAATALLQERGTADFTVQDVVERSAMSIRTFYKYFASKEDLLLAVSETVVAREAVPRLEKLVARHRDPVRRLRAFIEGLVELSTGTTKAVARTLASYQHRLAESRPQDWAIAMRPQFDLLARLIEEAAEIRPLRAGLKVEEATRLVHDLVLTSVHGRLFGPDGLPEISARKIWEFCAAGIGIDPAENEPPRAARPRRRPRPEGKRKREKKS